MSRYLLFIVLMFNALPGFTSSGSDSGEITLYFARHGETLLNTLDHVQGWADSPLTEEGQLSARYLGAGLKTISFDSVYSGDSGRHRSTLEIIQRESGSARLTPVELPGLRESFFGSYEGLRNEEMRDASARVLGLQDSQALMQEMVKGKVPIKQLQDAIAAADPEALAENYQQVKTRTHDAVKRIVSVALEKHEKNILIVTSGMTIMNLVYELTGKPLNIKPLANAAVVKIIYRNGQYRVIDTGTSKYIDAGKKVLAN